MNPIHDHDVLIWKYVNDQCDPGEQAMVEELLEVDPKFKQKFERIKLLQAEKIISESQKTEQELKQDDSARPIQWWPIIVAMAILILAAFLRNKI